MTVFRLLSGLLILFFLFPSSSMGGGGGVEYVKITEGYGAEWIGWITERRDGEVDVCVCDKSQIITYSSDLVSPFEGECVSRWNGDKLTGSGFLNHNNGELFISEIGGEYIKLTKFTVSEFDKIKWLNHTQGERNYESVSFIIRDDALPSPLSDVLKFKKGSAYTDNKEDVYGKFKFVYSSDIIFCSKNR